MTENPGRLTCEEVIERLLDYLDRELDATAEAEISRHLETCRGCFSRAEFERRLKARVSETGRQAAPNTLRQRIHALTDQF